MNKTETTPKDFFLHLGFMVALYVSVIALLNILFTVINTAFPRVDSFYYSSPSISFPVASLLVAFPLFILLSKLVYKSYEMDKEKKEIWVRRWLLVLTLFIAGAVLAGDFITVIYYFLDGRDLTIGFLLKALSVLLVTGGVFGYYLKDIKDTLTSKSRKVWLYSTTLVILFSIILGFSVIGSPKNMRLSRIDQQKVSDLENIQWQIVQYWQNKEALPKDLESFNDPISSFNVPKDPQSGEAYEYKVTGDLSFELCANFNLENKKKQNESPVLFDRGYGPINSSNWDHEAGFVCFERVIDPDIYKPLKR